MDENIKAHGAFTGTLIREDGTVQTVRKDNLVLNGGIDFLCDAFGKQTSRPNVMGYIAVGTGTTATENGQTALVSESLRKAASYSHTAGTTKLTLSATFAAGEATGALTEAGICNADAGGTFFDRVTFAVINKGANDTLTVNFDVTFTRG